MHMQTFDLDYGADVVMIARQDAVTPDQADACPVRRYVRGVSGSVRVIVHPDATPEQLIEACDRAWAHDLGRLDIV
jgi:hypothetical protein